MSLGDIAEAVALGVLFPLAIVTSIGWWRTQRRFTAYINRVNGWRTREDAEMRAPWTPDFVTSLDGLLEIRLVRKLVSGEGVRELDELTIGKVDLTETGWQQRMDELVLEVRDRMAHLNALIDSIPVQPEHLDK